MHETFGAQGWVTVSPTLVYPGVSCLQAPVSKNGAIYTLCNNVFLAFRALLDNYESETGKPEEVTEEELEENRHFLDIIMETQVMQEAHKFLVEKANVPDDVFGFKCLLYDIWFKVYKRLREDEWVDYLYNEEWILAEERK